MPPESKDPMDHIAKLWEIAAETKTTVALLQQNFARHIEFEERAADDRTVHRAEINKKFDLLFEAIKAGQDQIAKSKETVMSEVALKFVALEHLKIAQLQADLDQAHAINIVRDEYTSKLLDLDNRLSSTISRLNKYLWIGMGMGIAVNLLAWANKYGLI